MDKEVENQKLKKALDRFKECNQKDTSYLSFLSSLTKTVDANVFYLKTVCIDNYEYIYDFSNKVTVCHDKYFNELTAKLFSNEVYSSVFYEDIETTGEKEC